MRLYSMRIYKFITADNGETGITRKFKVTTRYTEQQGKEEL